MFPPNNRAPARLVRRFSYGLMDDRLRAAFRYPRISASSRHWRGG